MKHASVSLTVHGGGGNARTVRVERRAASFTRSRPIENGSHALKPLRAKQICENAHLGGNTATASHQARSFGDARPERRGTRWTRLVAQQAAVSFQHKAFLPGPDTGLRLVGLAHDLLGADAIGAQQHVPGSPHMLLQCVTIPRQRLQTTVITGLASHEAEICDHRSENEL